MVGIRRTAVGLLRREGGLPYDGAAGLRVVYSSAFFAAGAAWVDVAEECSPEVVLW